MLAWLKDKWAKFEAWVHSWFPGFKTRFVAGLGTAGMIAGYLQEYISGLPLTTWISTQTLMLISAGLFSLSYWFHGMGDRVEARVSVSNPTT